MPSKVPSEHVKQYRKQWWKDNGHRYVCRKKGITEKDYADLIAEQEGLCAICKKPSKNKKLDIDHDHITGRVRGLLCRYCNVQLGWFETNFTEALDYLDHIPSRRN